MDSEEDMSHWTPKTLPNLSYSPPAGHRTLCWLTRLCFAMIRSVHEA